MAKWRNGTTSEGMSVGREGVVVGMNWMNEQRVWIVVEVEGEDDGKATAAMTTKRGT